MINNQLIEKGAVFVISQHLSRVTEENSKKHGSGYSVFGVKFDSYLDGKT
jgi:hypothetical protein